MWHTPVLNPADSVVLRFSSPRAGRRGTKELLLADMTVEQNRHQKQECTREYNTTNRNKKCSKFNRLNFTNKIFSTKIENNEMIHSEQIAKYSGTTFKLLNSRVTHCKHARRADWRITNRLYENKNYFLTAE
jgi:hypothetical protein